MTDQVRLLLERDQAVITGTVELPGLEAQPFSGWLELIGALEEWRRAPVAQDDIPTLSTEDR